MSQSPIMAFTTLLWITKDILQVFIHSWECEKFYITVERAETACIQLMKSKDRPSKFSSILNLIAMSFLMGPDMDISLPGLQRCSDELPWFW